MQEEEEVVAVMRFVTGMAVVLGVSALMAVGAGAAGPPTDSNWNAGTVDLFCAERGEVTIWVNFVASDAGFENPALVLEDGRVVGVFKVVSVSVDGDDFELRFPGRFPESKLDSCTHPLGDLTVTLEGVFIP